MALVNDGRNWWWCRLQTSATSESVRSPKMKPPTDQQRNTHTAKQLLLVKRRRRRLPQLQHTHTHTQHTLWALLGTLPAPAAPKGSISAVSGGDGAGGAKDTSLTVRAICKHL